MEQSASPPAPSSPHGIARLKRWSEGPGRDSTSAQSPTSHLADTPEEVARPVAPSIPQGAAAANPDPASSPVSPSPAAAGKQDSQFLFSPAMDGVVSAQEGGQGAMPSADQEGVPAARLAAAEQSSEQHCGGAVGALPGLVASPFKHAFQLPGRIAQHKARGHAEKPDEKASVEYQRRSDIPG